MRIIPFRGPRKRIRKTKKFMEDWMKLQGLCKNKDTWREALIMADKLLDKALKKRKFKGSTMGERLVEAQKIITDNDDIWDAHNYVKKLLANDDLIPKEIDVKESLISFREALKDIGALQFTSKKDTNTSKK